MTVRLYDKSLAKVHGQDKCQHAPDTHHKRAGLKHGEGDITMATAN